MYKRRDPQRNEPYKAERLAEDRKEYVDPPGSPYADQRGSIVGNRDPERHVTAVKTLGFARSCKCIVHTPAQPCRVLDPFGGSGTTVMQALRMGLEADAIEINREYAALAVRRVLNDIKKRG